MGRCDAADIQPESLSALPTDLWNRKWFLLCAGDFTSGDYNFMTVSWGGLGTMWNKPFALVVVRPGRYTREFMDRSPGFTLSAFPEEHRRKLSYCGSHSGREGSKAQAAGFTPDGFAVSDGSFLRRGGAHPGMPEDLLQRPGSEPLSRSVH